MSEILLVTWDGGGNVPPALLLGAELAARGHAVRVLGHAGQRQAVEDAGLLFVPLRRARPFTALERHSVLDMMATFTDRGIGRDLLDELAARPADLVVVDCLLFGALDAARRSGVRYAVLEHLYDGYYRSGCLRGPLGLAHRVRRLRPRAALDGAAVRLVATVPELDPLPTRPEPNLRQVGPLVPLPDGPLGDASPPDAPLPTTGEPTVLVSLSTFAFPHAPRVLGTVLEAVRELPVHVVVTTGPALDPAEIPSRPGLEVHRFLSHAEVMPRASLVVGHGGHGTTVQALAHDLPVLVLPLDPQTDQPAVGRSLEAAGAGLVLRRSAGAAEVRDAVTRLLEDPSHRDAARRLGAAVRSRPARTLAADELEQALSDRAGRPAPEPGRRAAPR